MAKKSFWNGSATDWTDPGAWAPAGVPTAATIAVFQTGAAAGYSVSGSPPATKGQANIGEIEDDGDRVTLTGTFVTASPLNKDVPTAIYSHIGLRVDGGGTLTLAPGASITVLNGGDLFAGPVGQVYVGATSAGSLVIEGKLTDVGVAVGLYADGSATVSGPAAVWTTSIGINVGLSTANGTLLIRNGATVNTFAIQVGGGGATAGVEVTGRHSKLISTDTLEVQGAASSLLIVNGATVSCPNLDFSAKSLVALDATSKLAGDIALVGGTLEAIPEAQQQSTTVVDLTNPIQLLENTVNTVQSAVGAILELDGLISNFYDAAALTAGGGAVLLAHADNTYSAGTTIDAGVLGLAAAGAAGTGKITFATGADATLLAAADAVPTNAIAGFAAGDTIDLLGVADGTGLEAKFNATTDLLTLARSGTVEARLHFAAGSSFPDGFHLAPDGSTGTDITLAAHS